MYLSTRTKEVLTGLVVLFSLIGLFGGGELYIRIQQYLKFGTVEQVEKNEAFYTDEETGLRLAKPNAVSGVLKFSSQGFRSPELLDEDVEKVFRIAFVGSSTTLDPYTVNGEKTWPALYVEQFKAAYPQCKIDFINAGLPGLPTHRVNQYYKHKISSFKPDMTIVMSDDRAHALNRLAEKEGLETAADKKNSWFSEYSLFWERVEKNAIVQKYQRTAHREENTITVDKALLTESFYKELTGIVSQVAEHDGIPVILGYPLKVSEKQSRAEQARASNTARLYLPYMSVMDLLQAKKYYNEQSLAVAEKFGATFVDWQHAVPADDKHYADSNHFTAEGSRVFSDFLFQYLDDALKQNQQFNDRLNTKCGAL